MKTPVKKKVRTSSWSPAKKRLQLNANIKRKRGIEESDDETRKRDTKKKPKEADPSETEEESEENSSSDDYSSCNSSDEGNHHRKRVGRRSHGRHDEDANPSSDESDSSDDDNCLIRRGVAGNKGPKKEPSCLYRSNINSTIKGLCQLPLREEHMELLRLSPFWYLMESLLRGNSAKKLKMCKKHEKDIQSIIKSYSAEQGGFILGGKRVKLREDDFRLIFGVCDGDIDVESKLRAGDCKWVRRCFKAELAKSKGKKRFTMDRSSIHRKIQELIASTNVVDVEDVVQLVNCYVLVGILITYQNGSMNREVAALFEKLEEACLYAWCAYMLYMLISQIEAARGKAKTVGGCTMILPIFVCEHSDILKPTYPSEFPRYLKYDLHKLHEKLPKVGTRKLKGVRSKITATVGETQAFSMQFKYQDVAIGKSKIAISCSGNVSMSECSSFGRPTCDQSNEARGPAQLENIEEEEEQSALKTGENVTNLVGKPINSGLNELLKTPEIKVSEESVEAEINGNEGVVTNGAEVIKKIGVPEARSPIQSDEEDFLVDSTYGGAVWSTPDKLCQIVAEDYEVQYRGDPLIAPNEKQLCKLGAATHRVPDINNPSFFTPPQYGLEGVCVPNNVPTEITSVPETQSDPGPMDKEFVLRHLEVVTRDNVSLTNENIMLRNEVDELKSNASIQAGTMNKLMAQLKASDERLALELPRLLSENEKLRDQIKCLVDQKDVLQEKVNVCASGQERLSGLEEKVLSYETLIHEKERCVAQKQENIEDMMNKLKEKDEKVCKLRDMSVKLQNMVFDKDGIINELRDELKKYTDPTFTQLLQDPNVLNHIDTVVELHNVSAEKRALEEEKKADEAVLNEQQNLIETLVTVTSNLQATCVRPRSNSGSPVCEEARPIAVIDTDGVICLDIDDCNGGTGVPQPVRKIVNESKNVQPVSPNSMTKRIKDRTSNNERVPKKLSPFAVSSTRQNCVGGSSSRDDKTPVAEKNKMVLYEEFLAVQKTNGRTRSVLRKAWEAKGPMAVMWKGTIPMTTVLAGDVKALIHHGKVSDNLINAWGHYCYKDLKRRGRGTKMHRFPARLWSILMQEESPARQRFLKFFIDQDIEDIMENEVLLFPLNTTGGRSSPGALPDHWVLLKFVKSTGEWHLFNSMQQDSMGGVDPSVEDVQIVIDYVETRMRDCLKYSEMKHILQKRATRGRAIVKKCPQQIPGSFDCGIVVCYLIEKSMKREYNFHDYYSEEICSRQRSKMAQCFTLRSANIAV